MAKRKAAKQVDLFGETTETPESAKPKKSAAKPAIAPEVAADVAPPPADAKRLFLLDGMALLYRAHFALVRSPRFTSTRLCTSGIFGMATATLDILTKQTPSHLAVCFDTDHPLSGLRGRRRHRHDGPPGG